MQERKPLTRVGNGHVERVGKDMYLAIIKDPQNHYELMALDPHMARREAEEFCALNGISLRIFTVSPEVIRAHLNDIGDYLEEHAGAHVTPEYLPNIRRAV